MTPNEKNAFRCSGTTDAAGSEAESLVDEFRALLANVGSPGVMTVTLDPLTSALVDSPASLARFLDGYLTRLLLPCEWPAIVASCEHARRGQGRELVERDNRLAGELAGTPFLEPSRQMGRLHLARLRPLRDDRQVQRYLAAVDSGKAHGWHTMVFGLTLAVYSLPIRQALLYYAQETLRALAEAARRGTRITASEVESILTPLFERLPDALEIVLVDQARNELLSAV